MTKVDDTTTPWLVVPVPGPLHPGTPSPVYSVNNKKWSARASHFLAISLPRRLPPPTSSCLSAPFLPSKSFCKITETFQSFMQPLCHWPLVYHASLGFPFPRELAPYPTLALFSWGNRQLVLTFMRKISKESFGPFDCIQEENLLEQGHLFSSSTCRPAFSLSTRCSLCRTPAVTVSNAMKPARPTSNINIYLRQGCSV